MKPLPHWKWTFALLLAALPLAGCAQQNAHSATTNLLVTNPPTSTEAAIPEEGVNLEDAPGRIVSTATLPANNLSTAAAEIVKLVHAGIEETVLLSFITNSQYAFQLTSDDIIYLNDIGVPSEAITAMLQKDQALGVALASSAPVDPDQQVPAPTAGAPTPYGSAPDAAAARVVEAPLQPQGNVAYTYFYDSLAPYGNWIQIDGYGLCWQPTVVISNPGWQPYMDRGRWMYTSYGWYWVSDYSWGWAPFHYGRWFHHRRMGWCWAPDTVWGPSWVTWRYSSGYYGWAPLPPTACYTPGFGFSYYGRSVGVNFTFGLAAHHYTFVPVDRFCDRYPYRYRVPRHNVTHIYNNTVVVNQIIQGNNNTIINHGIPVRHVENATRTRIREVQVREVDRPMPARLDRHTPDREGAPTLAVFRPKLPAPTERTALVGQGVRPADRDWNIRRQDLTSRNNTSDDRTFTPRTPGSGRGGPVATPESGPRGPASEVRNPRQPFGPATTPGGPAVQRPSGVDRSAEPRERGGSREVPARTLPGRTVTPPATQPPAVQPPAVQPPATVPDRRDIRGQEPRSAPLTPRPGTRGNISESTPTPTPQQPAGTPGGQPWRNSSPNTPQVWNQRSPVPTQVAPPVVVAPNRPSTPVENRTLPQRQFTPQVPAATPAPAVRHPALESPRSIQRDTFPTRPQSAPAVEAPSGAPAPVQRWTPPPSMPQRSADVPQQQPRWTPATPSVERSIPARQAPVQTPAMPAPAVPRIESRPTPSMPAAPAMIPRAENRQGPPSVSQPSSRGNSGNRGNSDDGGPRGRR